MYKSENNYTKNQRFISDCKPALEIVQINDATTYRNTTIRVLMDGKEDWFSPQQLDNWIWDYGYEEQIN